MFPTGKKKKNSDRIKLLSRAVFAEHSDNNSGPTGFCLESLRGKWVHIDVFHRKLPAVRP